LEFQEHQFYEIDSYNLLNSGKHWYGESFSNNGIGSLNKTISINWPATLQNANTYFRSNVAGRTISGNSSFKIQLAGQAVSDINIPSVSGYFLDVYAQDAGITNGLGFPINLTASSISRPISVQYNFLPGNSDAQGWLDWFELQGDCVLQL
jgi:hypothetical protein